MNQETEPEKSRIAGLTLAALGVVYGDIGTSPLYAVKETFNPAHGIALTADTVIGGISAIFWSLMVVVSLKYVMLIMRASNKGEGGIMALLALALSSVRDQPRWHAPIALLGLVGAALFYGDAVLTPAISVLSAVEGLEVGTTALKAYVIPVSVGVLVTLFMFERLGSATVGALFGPIMVVWFIALAAVGIHGIVQSPAILHALNPLHGIAFVTEHGFKSFVVLGAVLLAFTGAEALYADMGHFGRRPIRLAWFGLVFPALALNYFGQGALLMVDAKGIENPFYLLFPSWALFPMVGMATVATVIASQATISGTYSLTRQAIQLGYLPRMRVLHTSARDMGQIYLPGVNWLLLAAVVAAVLGFGSSTNLASAYGVAVTGTMLITTFLTFFVIRYGWGYNLALCVLATGFFAMVDAAFFTSSLTKIAEGGWFPLSLGAVAITVMLTWRRGRQALLVNMKTSGIPLEPFLKSLLEHPLHRVEGTAVFLAASAGVVPRALLHNLSHNKVLHETVVFLNVVIEDVPYVAIRQRLDISSMSDGFWRAQLHFGFKDDIDVPEALALSRDRGLPWEMLQTSFFLSRESIVLPPGSGFSRWRDRLFAAMARNSGNAVEYFHLPSNRVIELGAMVEVPIRG